MSAQSTLALYEVLTRYLQNDEDARNTVDAVEGITQSKINTMEQRLLTKEDKLDIIREMKSDKAELFREMKSDKTELIREMKSDKAELIQMINKSKTDTIFWFAGALILHFVLNILYTTFFQ